ncbi:LysE family translocator [Rosenbergiella australiborealis]|uniref:LysE family translocator n=1 Tax=Rosenbergiella australiborealis TaxID=1544696 RepID=UPI001F4E144B
MSDWGHFTTIGIAILLGAMSPGASFLLATRIALTSRFRASLAVAIGLGMGAAIFALAAVCGLHFLLLLVSGGELLLRAVGGAYLLWMAVKIIRKKPTTLRTATLNEIVSWQSAFFIGLITQLSNPNTALLFASLFTSLLGPELSSSTIIALPTMTFLIDFTWFTVVALLLSRERPRRFYLRYKLAIDRLSAFFLAVLGIKLLLP